MRSTLIAATLTAALLAGRPALLDHLRVFLGALWSAAAADEGCIMDPDGACRPAPPEASDEGCGMDPSGACRPAPQNSSDAGCIMDPSGCPKAS